LTSNIPTLNVIRQDVRELLFQIDQEIMKNEITKSLPINISIVSKISEQYIQNTANNLKLSFAERKKMSSQYLRNDEDNKIDEGKRNSIKDSYRKKRHVITPQEESVFNHFENECGIVSRSECMLDIFKEIKIAAPSKIGILILGETGTGKSLIASAIHKMSGRSGDFIEADCIGIPKDIESELFGVIPNYPGFHNKEGQIGLFKQAHKGTIFLDEVGDASYAVQGKIRRVIQEKKVQPLGGKDESVEIRVICATNIDLQRSIGNKSFRKDLYNRIAQKVIQMPPLHKRKEDIPLIAKHLFHKKCKEEGISFNFEVRQDHFEALLTRSDINDIRELENRVYELVVNLMAQANPGIKSLMALLKPKAQRILKEHNENYPQHLITYINTGFNKLKTSNMFGDSDTRILRGKINTEVLRIGENFKFNEIAIVDHLISQYSLNASDRDKMIKQIINSFKEIIQYHQTKKERRSAKRAYSKECEQLAVRLTKTRPDLT